MNVLETTLRKLLQRKKRVPESVAAAVLLAASFALHAGWIANMLSARSARMRDWFTIHPQTGAIGGYYLLAILVFFSVFAIAMIGLKGSDCSKYRDHLFWFFLVSIVTFLIMTLPFVYMVQLYI